MKSILYYIHLAAILTLLGTFTGFGATKTTTVSGGSWNAGGTWVGGAVPAGGDTAVIVPGASVTVTANASINSITFSNASSSTAILTVNSNVTLTVAATILQQNAATTNTAALIQGPGTINCVSLTVGGTTTPTPTSSYFTATLTSTISSLNISGNLAVKALYNSVQSAANAGTFALGSGWVTVNGNVAFTTVPLFGPILNMAIGSQNGTLELSGSTPFTFTGGGSSTFNPSGTNATVIYSGAAQTVNAATYQDVTTFVGYQNLILDGSGTKTNSGVLVNGILSMQGTATASNSQTNGPNATLEYNGSAAQTTGPELTATLPNLRINNDNGVTLSSNSTISGTLTLTNGMLITGAKLISLATNASVSGGSANSYINGNLQKTFSPGTQAFTFPIGDGSSYAPLALSGLAVTTSGSIKASTTSGDHPQILTSGIDPNRSVNRYWTLTQSGGTFGTYNTVYNYPASDVDAGATASQFVVNQWTGAWSAEAVSGTPTTTSTSVSSQSGFGDFVIGDPSGWLEQVKANNNTALQSNGSWVNGIAPGAGDYAIWNSTVSTPANCTNTLGSAVTWDGIAIGNPSAPVSINGNTTLTLNNGINMGSAARNLILNCGTISVASNQTWTVGSGRTLTTGSSASAGSINGSNNWVTLAGGGTWSLSGTGDDNGLGIVVSAGTVDLNKSSSSGVHAVGGPGMTVNSGSLATITGTGGDQIYDGADIVVDGTFDLFGNSETIDSLNGSGTITTTLANGTPTLTIGSANGGGDFTGTIQDGNTGSITLTKTGTGVQTVSRVTRGSGTAGPNVSVNAGTLTLDGSEDNVYTGVTVKNNATLILAKISNTSVHALGSVGLIINSGGTVQLAGTGGDQIYNGCPVTNNGTFDLNGHSETVTSLSFNGGTLLNSAAAGQVTGTLTDTGTLSMNGNVTVSYPNAPGGTNIVLQYSGTRSGSGSFVAGSLPVGSTVIDNTTTKTVSVVNPQAPVFVVNSLTGGDAGEGFAPLPVDIGQSVALGSPTRTIQGVIFHTNSASGNGLGIITFTPSPSKFGFGTTANDTNMAAMLATFTYSTEPGDATWDGTTNENHASYQFTALTSNVTYQVDVFTVADANPRYTLMQVIGAQMFSANVLTLTNPQVVRYTLAPDATGTITVNYGFGGFYGSSTGNAGLVSGMAITTTNKMVLTVASGLAANNKVYNRTTTATISSNTVVLAGVLADDTGNVSLSTNGYTAAFTNATVGNGKTVTVGGLTLTGSAVAKYTLTQPGLSANITAATLTVSATGVNKVYNGTTNATVTLSDNRISGDVLTTSYTTANFADKNIGNGKTINVNGINVNGTDSGNYTANTTAGTTANITQTALTVSAAGVNKVYDGTTNTTVTLSDNRISGDTLTTSYTTAGFADKNVGNGKTVNVNGITVTGADSGNYTFNTTAGTTANITQATLTVSATGVNKVYDGTTNATMTLTDNRIPGDTLTTSYATAGFADKNVGNNKTVNVNSITVTGTDSGNYTFNTTASTTANITQATLTVNATGVNKIYDGTTNATVTLSDNRITGDTPTTSYTAAGFADKNVGNDKTVNVIGITVTGTDSGNYTFNTTASTTANITQATLTVSATGINKVYDGTTNTTVTLSDNRISGDVLTTSYTTAGFADNNVGNGKTVNVSGITVAGVDSGNYTANMTASTTANITSATLTVSADNKSRAYGTTNPQLTASYSGFAGGEGTNVLNGHPALSTTADTNSPVGVYPIAIDQGTLTAANYTFSFTNGTLTIIEVPTTLTITFTPGTNGQPSLLTLYCAGLTPGNTCYILASPDLSSWTQISTQPAAPDGTLTFTDTNSIPTRFYRLSTN